MPREQFQCKWGSCDKSFEAVEDLFNHLTDEHVGRKSTNNLCLECHWENCNTVAAKRDHLASHLRVHLPLKPHHCQLCNKGFKRPQDLKKHERIHTIEHQSSLLSNQPGYKPQRRRRKPAQSTPSQKGSSEVSELSSCSPSFLSMSPGEHDDNQKLFQDPLNGFINDILMEQAQPTYDADMMNRLNSIAPALQYQAQWNLPCTPESVPTLQNWLEQLSSNIQTDENMYPTILTPPQATVIGNPPVVDYDLYPKLNDNNEWTTPSFTTHSEKTVDSPTTPPMTQVTPREEKENEIKPNFWTPGYITNDTYRDATMMDGPYPSEAVDFTTMIRPSCSVEPNTNFETTKQEADVLKPGFDTSTTYEEKKSLMHMINQFNSPYDNTKTKITNSDKQKPSIVVIDETEGNKGNTDGAKNDEIEKKKEVDNDDDSADAKSDISSNDNDEEEEELASSSSRRSSISSSNYSYVYPNDQHNKSPYNELLDSIENMNLEDEETTRKRHLKLIDDLYKMISQMS